MRRGILPDAPLVLLCTSGDRARKAAQRTSFLATTPHFNRASSCFASARHRHLLLNAYRFRDAKIHSHTSSQYTPIYIRFEQSACGYKFDSPARAR